MRDCRPVCIRLKLYVGEKQMAPDWTQPSPEAHDLSRFCRTLRLAQDMQIAGEAAVSWEGVKFRARDHTRPWHPLLMVA